MIPVIINNRNLLSWPRMMVERIKTFKNVGDIIIVDNDSTYPPLLEWYDSAPCEIMRIENMGHSAPWDCGLVSKFTTPYVVTDPDLGLNNVRIDVLDKLLEKLNSNPNLKKVGLILNHVLSHSPKGKKSSPSFSGIGFPPDLTIGVKHTIFTSTIELLSFLTQLCEMDKRKGKNKIIFKLFFKIIALRL